MGAEERASQDEPSEKERRRRKVRRANLVGRIEFMKFLASLRPHALPTLIAISFALVVTYLIVYAPRLEWW